VGSCGWMRRVWRQRRLFGMFGRVCLMVVPCFVCALRLAGRFSHTNPASRHGNGPRLVLAVMKRCTGLQNHGRQPLCSSAQQWQAGSAVELYQEEVHILTILYAVRPSLSPHSDVAPGFTITNATRSRRSFSASRNASKSIRRSGTPSKA